MLTILQSQFRAALAMLREAIGACPETLWADPSHSNQYWRIAYHALFYAHLYLSPSDEEFVPWKKGIPDANYMGPVPWPPYDVHLITGSNTKEELLEYADIIEEFIPTGLGATPLDGETGFSWLPFSRLELHLYNIRHVQHHAGQLVERLRANGISGVAWVGRKYDPVASTQNGSD